MKSVKTYSARIWIAGDYNDARRALKDFCKRGSCWTISKVQYIYTGGEESGVCVTRINYPRFPACPSDIKMEALHLASLLKDRLFQRSFCIEFPDETLWHSDDCEAAE